MDISDDDKKEIDNFKNFLKQRKRYKEIDSEIFRLEQDVRRLKDEKLSLADKMKKYVTEMEKSNVK